MITILSTIAALLVGAVIGAEMSSAKVRSVRRLQKDAEIEARHMRALLQTKVNTIESNLRYLSAINSQLSEEKKRSAAYKGLWQKAKEQSLSTNAEESE